MIFTNINKKIDRQIQEETKQKKELQKSFDSQNKVLVNKAVETISKIYQTRGIRRDNPEFLYSHADVYKAVAKVTDINTNYLERLVTYICSTSLLDREQAGYAGALALAFFSVHDQDQLSYVDNFLYSQIKSVLISSQYRYLLLGKSDLTSFKWEDLNIGIDSLPVFQQGFGLLSQSQMVSLAREISDALPNKR